MKIKTIFKNLLLSSLFIGVSVAMEKKLTYPMQSDNTLPDQNGRLAIIQKYFNDKQLNLRNDFLAELVEETEGLSSSNLDMLCHEAFKIAFDEQYNPINDSPESDEETAERDATISMGKIHFILAAYITQNLNIPNLQIKILLFAYFFSKQKLAPKSEDLILLAKEAEDFSVLDIKSSVEIIRGLIDQRSRTYTILDLLSGLYYDQKIKFADSDMRAALFAYFLENETIMLEHNNTFEDLYCQLAYYAADDFTGKEISAMVDNAAIMAEFDDTEITKKHLIISLYQMLLKKAKPYKICKELFFGDNNPNSNLVEIYALGEDEEFIKRSIISATSDKKNRLDYRNKVQPSAQFIEILINYLLEKIPCKLSDIEITTLANKAFEEKFSWYSVTKLTNLAKKYFWESVCAKLNFDHFIKAFRIFNISIDRPQDQDEQGSCILS